MFSQVQAALSMGGRGGLLPEPWSAGAGSQASSAANYGLQSPDDLVRTPYLKALVHGVTCETK